MPEKRDDSKLIAVFTRARHWIATKRRGRCLTLLLCIREVLGSILGHGDGLSGLSFLVVFLSPSRLMPGYCLKIRPRPLPIRSFPIHHLSPIIVSLTLHSLVTETASLNKLPTCRWIAWSTS
jgi:hypothetical protein